MKLPELPAHPSSAHSGGWSDIPRSSASMRCAALLQHSSGTPRYSLSCRRPGETSKHSLNRSTYAKGTLIQAKILVLAMRLGDPREYDCTTWSGTNWWHQTLGKARHNAPKFSKVLRNMNNHHTRERSREDFYPPKHGGKQRLQTLSEKGQDLDAEGSKRKSARLLPTPHPETRASFRYVK